MKRRSFLGAGLAAAGEPALGEIRALSDGWPTTSTFPSVAVDGSGQAGGGAAGMIMNAEPIEVGFQRTSTRGEMSALDTSVITLVFLEENGREGFFRWLTGDYSVHVAADIAAGIYVGANAIEASAGAWVRLFDGVQSIHYFGGVADGETDNADAFMAAASVGGQVYIPDGIFLVNLTEDNFDILARGLFIKCVGPGLIDARLAAGKLTASDRTAVFDQETCRIKISGKNENGNLLSAMITVSDTNGEYHATIKFTNIPRGMEIGQLLSITSADRSEASVVLSGALVITAISDDDVTVRVPYKKGAYAPLPSKLMFTGTYVNGQSRIDFGYSGTIFAIVADGVKLSLSCLTMTGPGASGMLQSLNAVGASIGIKDEIDHFCNSTLKISDCLINGFNCGVLQHGGNMNIQRPHIGGCWQGARFVRGAQALMTDARIGCNFDNGIHIEALSKVIHEGEGFSCGNGGRGVWAFSGGWYSTGPFETSFNSVGIYGKNGSVIYSAPNSSARFNDGIGYGNENSFVNLISTSSLDNRGTGYEIGAGGFTDLSKSVSLRNEQAVYALVSAGAECAEVEAGYSAGGNGIVAAEGSTIRAKRSWSHHNLSDGYTAIGNSHIRNDNSEASYNGGYGERAQLNSSVRQPNNTLADGNASGAKNADKSSIIA